MFPQSFSNLEEKIIENQYEVLRHSTIFYGDNLCEKWMYLID